MAVRTPELIDELFGNKGRQACLMMPGEKLLAGPRLFDYARRVAKDAIRYQHPGASEAQVAGLLRQRVELARRLECVE